MMAVGIFVIDATANRLSRRHGDAEAAMGEAAGILEDRGAVAPGERDAAEGVLLRLLVEPGAELGVVHRAIVPSGLGRMRA